MVGKYKVITLCGSTRFKDAFMEAQKRLTLEGNIVISVEETNGWFIFEKCENEAQILSYTERVRLPVYTGEELAKKYASVRTA